MTLKAQVCAYRGMLFALLAGVCSSSSGMFVKLTHHIHSLEILIFRLVQNPSIHVCVTHEALIQGHLPVHGLFHLFP